MYHLKLHYLRETTTRLHLVKLFEDVMHAHFPYGNPGSITNNFKFRANLRNNTIAIANTTDKFEQCTDEQSLAFYVYRITNYEMPSMFR